MYQLNPLKSLKYTFNWTPQSTRYVLQVKKKCMEEMVKEVREKEQRWMKWGTGKKKGIADVKQKVPERGKNNRDKRKNTWDQTKDNKGQWKRVSKSNRRSRKKRAEYDKIIFRYPIRRRADPTVVTKTDSHGKRQIGGWTSAASRHHWHRVENRCR